MGGFKLFRLLQEENLRAMNHRRAELKQEEIDRRRRRRGRKGAKQDDDKSFDEKFREAMG